MVIRNGNIILCDDMPDYVPEASELRRAGLARAEYIELRNWVAVMTGVTVGQKMQRKLA